MANALYLNYEYCSGCHSCELACRNELGLDLGQWGIKVHEDGPYKNAEDDWHWNYYAINTEQCRMIICQLVDEIRVKRGYCIELKLSFTFEQFLEHADKRILEEERFIVEIAGESDVDGETNDLNLHDAVANILDENPELEWEDAIQRLEIPIPKEQTDVFVNEVMHIFNTVENERSKRCMTQQ
ncbi:hypothetical protein [Slackia exigua]|uniref:hypothetical protein n=1 Tax=Slackia exigua TaxID=84109 RepID=UPI0028D40BED|nr:hypothetical protein [Slackia exigua]